MSASWHPWCAWTTELDGGFWPYGRLRTSNSLKVVIGLPALVLAVTSSRPFTSRSSTIASSNVWEATPWLTVHPLLLRPANRWLVVTGVTALGRAAASILA